jgi:hypothetical protein
MDVEAAWTFAPGHKVVGYAVADVGYSWAFDTADTTPGGGVRS